MEKQKQNLFAILVVIVALAFFYFLAWGEIGETYNVYTVMQQEQREKESLESLIAEAPSLEQRFETLKFDAERVLDVAPKTLAEEDHIVAFASLASQSGALLRSITIDDPGKDGSVKIETEIVGSIASLERFLRALETSIPLFDFVATSFDGKNDVQQFKITATTYLLPESEVVTLSFSELKQKLEEALKTKLDILKDPQFQQLNPIQGLPVQRPLRENIGRENPFTPF